MDSNVGDMPVDIYQDYLLDVYDIDFPWEFIVPINYWYNRLRNSTGNGTRYSLFINHNLACGTGYFKSIAGGDGIEFNNDIFYRGCNFGDGTIGDSTIGDSTIGYI